MDTHDAIVTSYVLFNVQNFKVFTCICKNCYKTCTVKNDSSDKDYWTIQNTCHVFVIISEIY